MTESFAALLHESLSTLDMQPGSIVSGVVLDVDNDWVTVHVGLKSEGVVSLDEFRNNEGEVSIVVGDEVEVALEAVEDGYGETRISSCLLYTSPSPRDRTRSRMPSSA